MIEGDLRNIPLTEVFQIVVQSQKSGILTIEKDAYRGRVYFERGRVQYAHISPGVHLGEVLVRMDLLTTFEVQTILNEQVVENAGTPLGLLAVQKGFLEADDLKRALSAQAIEGLTELMLWRDGQFTFEEPSANATQVATDVTLDAMTLLLEISSRIDDWREGTVEPGVIFEKCGDPSKLTLSPEAWEVLSFVDSKRRADSIAAELDLSEMQVYHLLYELQNRKVIAPLSYVITDPLILVVSPSSAMQRLIKLVLQRARLRVQTSYDYGLGLIHVLEQRPRAVVIDSKSNDSGGWDFIRELRKLPGQSHLPVVMLTDKADGGGFFNKLWRPKAQLIEKPFEELELQQLTAELVGRPLA